MLKLYYLPVSAFVTNTDNSGNNAVTLANGTTGMIKILYTKYDKREKMTFETQKFLEKNFRDYLIPHYIKTSTAYSNSFNNNRTIYGSHAVNKSKKDYDFLFKYLLEINI